MVAPFSQQPFFSERIVHLPDCYQVNDSNKGNFDTPAAAQRAWAARAGLSCSVVSIMPGRSTGACSISGCASCRASRTACSGCSGRMRPRPTIFAKRRKRAGVSPDRLIFARFVELADHLARLQQADLFLDTLPYNAHTTASDALWAGVPVLTCTGQSFAGRVGASLLHAAGLPELVTDDLAAYEALALALANDPAQLQIAAAQARANARDLSIVRHRSLPPSHRGGLSYDVGHLAAWRTTARLSHRSDRSLIAVDGRVRPQGAYCTAPRRRSASIISFWPPPNRTR